MPLTVTCTIAWLKSSGLGSILSKPLRMPIASSTGLLGQHGRLERMGQLHEGAQVSRPRADNSPSSPAQTRGTWCAVERWEVGRGLGAGGGCVRQLTKQEPEKNRHSKMESSHATPSMCSGSSVVSHCVVAGSRRPTRHSLDERLILCDEFIRWRHREPEEQRSIQTSSLTSPA